MDDRSAIKSVTIIGPGRVGRALALALPRTRYVLDALVYRTASGWGGRALSFDKLERVSSELVLIATQDAEIERVARSLGDKLTGGQIVLHTSGVLASDVIGGLKPPAAGVGSIHPLVSISDPEGELNKFKGAHFCIEGDETAVATANTLALDLGGIPFSIDTGFKPLYHAAAVTACGHLVALIDAAIEMLEGCGIDRTEAQSMLMPLVESTINNLGHQTPASALTGTFARADVEAFRSHLSALDDLGHHQIPGIYLTLAERSLDLAATQGADGAKLEMIRNEIAVAKLKLK